MVEAAILAPRTALLPPREIEAEFHKLAVLVEKTGGPRGHEVLTLLQRRVRREAEA